MSERLMAAVANAPVTPALQGLITRAGTYAGAQGHRTVKLEHLLLTLTEDGEAVHLLETCSVDISRLRTEIAQYLDHHDDRDPSGETIDPPPHPELLRAITHAAAAARGRAVGPPVVLAAVVGEGTTTAASLLSVQGFSFQAAVTALQQIAARARAQAGQGFAGHQPPQPQSAPQPASHQMHPVQPPHVRPPQAPPPPEPVPLRPPSRQGDAPTSPPAAVIGAEELMNSARRGIETARLPSPPPLPPRAFPEVVPNPPPPPAAVKPPASASHAPAMLRRPAPPPVSNPPPTYPGAPSDLFAPAQPAHPAAPSGERPRQHPSPPGGMPRPMPGERPYYGPRDAGSGAQRVQAPHHGTAAAQPQAARAPVQPPGYPQSPGEFDRSPAPHLEQVARRHPHGPPPSVSSSPSTSRTSPSTRQPEIGRLVETIPRRASVGDSRIVDVRVRRADIAGFMPAHTLRASPDGCAMQAVCVRLRAPDGGIAIETLTPETAWLDADAGGLADEYATWRWRLLPMMRGRRKLVLSLAVRRIGEEGLTAETNLPDQVFEVSVRPNITRALAWVGGIVATLVVGFVAGSFGKAIVSSTLSAIATLSSG